MLKLLLNNNKTKPNITIAAVIVSQQEVAFITRTRVARIIISAVVLAPSIVHATFIDV